MLHIYLTVMVQPAQSKFFKRGHSRAVSTQFLVLLDFSLTVKAAPHACISRTGQP